MSDKLTAFSQSASIFHGFAFQEFRTKTQAASEPTWLSKSEDRSQKPEKLIWKKINFPIYKSQVIELKKNW